MYYKRGEDDGRKHGWRDSGAAWWAADKTTKWAGKHTTKNKRSVFV